VAKKKHQLLLLLLHLLLKLLPLHLLLLLPLLLLKLLPLLLLARRSNFFCFKKMPPSGGFFLPVIRLDCAAESPVWVESQCTLNQGVPSSGSATSISAG
jgi:hypothetical protein